MSLYPKKVTSRLRIFFYAITASRKVCIAIVGRAITIVREMEKKRNIIKPKMKQRR